MAIFFLPSSLSLSLALTCIHLDIIYASNVSSYSHTPRTTKQYQTRITQIEQILHHCLFYLSIYLIARALSCSFSLCLPSLSRDISFCCSAPFYSQANMCVWVFIRCPAMDENVARYQLVRIWLVMAWKKTITTTTNSLAQRSLTMLMFRHRRCVLVFISHFVLIFDFFFFF